MDTRVVFDFLPPILGALWDNADRLSNVDNFHATVIYGYKLYIVRTNCVSLSVVVTHNGAVINALDTALIGFLADEAVVAILASISNTKDATIKEEFFSTKLLIPEENTILMVLSLMSQFTTYLWA